jgi:hypothetical protein
MKCITMKTLILFVALALSSCAGPQIDSTNRQTFDHSVAVILHGKRDIDATIFRTRMVTAQITFGEDQVRRDLDAKTYGEALAYFDRKLGK